MAMMIGILDKSIKDMKNLRQREERRDNKAAQEALDQRFSVLTSVGTAVYKGKNAVSIKWSDSHRIRKSVARE